ncbi:MAG: PAS domain-containing protein [Ferruginibacter sp.]|nr:PAS domain-containing protein [Cytophagales bacterium]
MNTQHFDFDQARAKHLQFKSRLRSILYGAPMDEQPVLSHYECGVGKWIYAHGLVAYGHIPEMHELEKVHATIHTVARELVGRYQQGEVEQARRGLPLMEKVALELNELLTTIERKVTGIERAPADESALLAENLRLFRELKAANYELEERIEEQTVELQKSKERFELASLATQDVIMDWDIVQKTVWWNDSYRSQFGYPSEAIEPGVESWYNQIHPRDRERIKKEIEQTFSQENKQWSGEYRFRAAKGFYRHVNHRSHILYQPPGQPCRMVGSLQDVTDRKRTQEALLKSHQKERTARREVARQKARLERFFQQAPAAICILDGAGLVFELINPGYQQLLPERNLLGKPLLEALPEIAGQPIQTILENVYQTGETFEGKEILVPVARHENAPLEERYFNFTYQARYDEQGRIDGGLVFAYEVTNQVLARRKVEESERQLQALSEELAATNEEIAAANEEISANNDALTTANEELSTANGQLTRVNADIDNFIYAASHDLKAPISNIEGLIQMLVRAMPAESLAPERVRRITSLIEESIGRFKKTIYHLTEVTKLQKDNDEDVSLVDLKEVVQEVLLDLELLVQTSGARIQVDVEECGAIRFSAKNLRSIVYNLISNAIKYRSSERVPLVSVSCRQTGEHAVLSVADNGLGIDMSQEKKLFAMFGRLHDHVEGSGVGLYMVKKMVDNASGRIEVASQVGQGSTFTIYFRQ